MSVTSSYQTSLYIITLHISYLLAPILSDNSGDDGDDDDDSSVKSRDDSSSDDDNDDEELEASSSDEAAPVPPEEEEAKEKVAKGHKAKKTKTSPPSSSKPARPQSAAGSIRALRIEPAPPEVFNDGSSIQLSRPLSSNRPPPGWARCSHLTLNSVGKAPKGQGAAAARPLLSTLETRDVEGDNEEEEDQSRKKTKKQKSSGSGAAAVADVKANAGGIKKGPRATAISILFRTPFVTRVSQHPSQTLFIP